RAAPGCAWTSASSGTTTPRSTSTSNKARPTVPSAARRREMGGSIRRQPRAPAEEKPAALPLGQGRYFLRIVNEPVPDTGEALIIEWGGGVGGGRGGTAEEAGMADWVFCATGRQAGAAHTATLLRGHQAVWCPPPGAGPGWPEPHPRPGERLWLV